MPWKLTPKTVTMTVESYNRIKQDREDMRNACQTIFTRCACGRIAEKGVICPTNQEGGNCEEGS